MFSAERLYTQGELDDALNRAADDGLQAGAQATVDAYNEGRNDGYRNGFHVGYAAAVEDHEQGEFRGPAERLKEPE